MEFYNFVVGLERRGDGQCEDKRGAVECMKRSAEFTAAERLHPPGMNDTCPDTWLVCGDSGTLL